MSLQNDELTLDNDSFAQELDGFNGNDFEARRRRRRRARRY